MKYEFNMSTKSIRLFSWIVAVFLLAAMILGYQSRQYFADKENSFVARADTQMGQSGSNIALGATENEGQLAKGVVQRTDNADIDCNGLIQEAETGTLSGLFTVGTDINASGGQYVHVPQGSGDRFDGADSAHKVTFCVMITEAGTYRVKSHVYAQGASNDSMYVQLNDSPSDMAIWNVPQNSSYDEAHVTSAQTSEIVSYGLTAGPHTFTFFLREDDTRLDKIELELIGSMPSLAAANLAPTVKEPQVWGHIHADLGDSWIPKQAEPQVAGITITVVDATSNGQMFNQTTTTDSEGNYSLSGMIAGVYTVNVAVPDGHRSIGPTELTVFTNKDQTGFASFDLMVLDQDPLIDRQDDRGVPNIYVPLVHQ